MLPSNKFLEVHDCPLLNHSIQINLFANVPDTRLKDTLDLTWKSFLSHFSQHHKC